MTITFLFPDCRVLEKLGVLHGRENHLEIGGKVKFSRSVRFRRIRQLRNMNAKFSELKGSTVRVSNSSGVYEFSCARAIRGKGKDKYMVTMEGFSVNAPEVRRQYYLEFGGKKWGAAFESVVEVGEGLFQVELCTFISEESFWA